MDVEHGIERVEIIGYTRTTDNLSFFVGGYDRHGHRVRLDLDQDDALDLAERLQMGITPPPLILAQRRGSPTATSPELRLARIQRSRARIARINDDIAAGAFEKG